MKTDYIITHIESENKNYHNVTIVALQGKTNIGNHQIVNFFEDVQSMSKPFKRVLAPYNDNYKLLRKSIAKAKQTPKIPPKTP